MKCVNVMAFALIAACVSTGTCGQEREDADPLAGFKLKPIVIDAKGGSGTVLGVDFNYKKTWEKLAPFDEATAEVKKAANKQKTGMFGTVCGGFSEDQSVIPKWVTFNDCTGEVSLKGTLAADAAKNPNKLVDFSGAYLRRHTKSDQARSITYAAGGQAKYETDQSFDNKQFVFGLKGTFTHLTGCDIPPGGTSCPPLDFFGLSAGIQRVNPAKDEARKIALAGASLENYKRWELDAYYKYNVPKEWSYLSNVELNYRHFQELSPPDVIRQAGLHRHRLGLLRVNFGLAGKGATAVTPDMFVEYSRGSLPFDTESERVVKIGLTFKVF